MKVIYYKLIKNFLEIEEEIHNILRDGNVIRDLIKKVTES
jgi:hypothetical protein